jgi:hypothetical protein
MSYIGLRKAFRSKWPSPHGAVILVLFTVTVVLCFFGFKASSQRTNAELAKPHKSSYERSFYERCRIEGTGLGYSIRSSNPDGFRLALRGKKLCSLTPFSTQKLKKAKASFVSTKSPLVFIEANEANYVISKSQVIFYDGIIKHRKLREAPPQTAAFKKLSIDMEKLSFSFKGGLLFKIERPKTFAQKKVSFNLRYQAPRLSPELKAFSRALSLSLSKKLASKGSSKAL